MVYRMAAEGSLETEARAGGEPEASPAAAAGGRHRALAAAGYAAAFALFFVLCYLTARTTLTSSDGANNALQGFDLLHGNPLLSGWIIGDATYYTFELPVFAITTGVFGLGPTAGYVEPAIVYLIIAILAAALAKGRTTGAQGAVRVGAVLALLCSPLYARSTSGGAAGAALLLAEPNHLGTCVFLLASFLLLDRGAHWRATPVVLLLILTAGQLGDATVRFVGVGTVLAVSLARMARERSLKTPDTKFVIAAIASVAASEGLRALMRAAGAYTMVPPVTQLVYPNEWPSHLWYTARVISKMFGIVAPLSNSVMSGICIGLSAVALLAVVYALVRTAVRWSRVERADQLLAVGALALFGAYTVYALATITNTHEISEFVPVSAALAARAIPKGIAVLRPTAIAVATVTLVPLIAAAVRPTAVSTYTPMLAWLEAHGQSYGISTYWLASSTTLRTSGQVSIRSVINDGDALGAYPWETKISWYDPKLHDATFVIANIGDPPGDVSPADVQRIYGAPSLTAIFGSHEIMVYPVNLLDKVLQPLPASG
jgi:hypothetical protein